MRVKAVCSAVGGGLLLWAAAAPAEDRAPLCSERPGLTTNECVIAPGHVQVETGLADWTLDRSQGERTDTLLLADTLVRVGVGGGWELRLGWTPYGYVRDSEDGMVDHAHRAGDITIGLKKNLIDVPKHGDAGLSFAVIPFATVPVGRMPVGAGDWGAGAQLPLGYRFTKTFKVEFTSDIEAAVDEDGHGRHLLYSGALGVKYDLTDAISVQPELKLLRDDDPDRAQRGTQALAGLSLGYQPADKLQFDIGVNAGLNRKAPDAEVYAGITRAF